MIQRMAVRWILVNYSRQASVTEMLNHQDWRSLEQRRNYSRLCLFFKIIHGLVAVCSAYNKNSHPLHAGIDYYKYSFYSLAIMQRNRLPPKIALLPTFELFKRAVYTISHPMHKCQRAVLSFKFQGQLFS